MGQAFAEPGYGFQQISGQPKETGAGTGIAYGDTVCYVIANNRWEKAVAASVQPFGFCGNTDILTQSRDELTGVVTVTKGVPDAAASLSVIVSGRVLKKADGAIPAGEFVMLGTVPTTEVKVWDGVNTKAIVGRYVINTTQHHAADSLPAAADDDMIKIDVIQTLSQVHP